MSLGLDIDDERENSIIVAHYRWASKHVSFLLSGFFGKLIISHGYLEKGDQFWVPDFTVDPVRFFRSPPFNDVARKATSIDLDLSKCKDVLINFLFNNDPIIWSRIVAACESYSGALRFLSSDPMLAFVLILSALEVLSLSTKLSDEEVFDKKLYDRLLMIRDKLDDGEKIYNDIRARLFQISQRTAIYVDRMLDDSFYSGYECHEPFMALQKDGIKLRIKAAYSLRSKYLHTGQSIGGWAEYNSSMHAEVVLGDPVVEDKELKKMISRAPTLNGLERILQYCLCKEIQGAAVKSSLEMDSHSETPDTHQN